VRDLKFKQLGILSIVAVIISSVCAIGTAIKGWNAYALVLYQVLNAFISTIGCIVLSRYTFSVRFRKSDFLKHFSFGFYTTLANIIDAIYDNILVVITGKISTVNQVGYMSQSKKIQEVSTSGISLSINNVAFPILTKFRDEKELFVRESDQLISTVSLLLFPILVLISIFSKQIILIIFGEQWIDATPYLSALMVAGIFVILERLIRNYIKSLLLVKELLKITILQRLVGLAIIVGLTILSHKLLILSYVFASIIVWLISSLKYTQLIDISFKQFLAEQCSAIVPSLLFFVILKILSYAINNIVIMFAITVVLMTVYYFVILPQCYSLRIQSIVKSLFRN
jgi:O-antigen/teichoic acid export membrane protein